MRAFSEIIYSNDIYYRNSINRFKKVKGFVAPRADLTNLPFRPIIPIKPIVLIKVDARSALILITLEGRREVEKTGERSRRSDDPGAGMGR
jgi:hypothetical protein